MTEVERPARLTPHFSQDRWEWIDAPEDSNFAGFTAEVRTNLTNGEIRDYLQAVSDIEMDRLDAGYWRLAESRRLEEEAKAEGVDHAAITAQRKALIDAYRDKMASFDLRTYALMAPYIRAWNSWVREDGEEAKPVPPPSQGGVEVFALIDPAQTQWLVGTLATAYRSGKGLERPSTLPSDSPEPTLSANDGPQMVSE